MASKRSEKFREKLTRLWHNKWLFGGVIAFFSAVLALIFATQFENLEFRSYDLRFAIRGQQPTEQDNIVIVAIDDQTFSSLRTRWPFPRALYARAIRNLSAAGARLIIVDVEFTEQSRRDPQQDIFLAAAIRRAGNVLLSGKLVTEVARNDIQNSYILPPIRLLLEAGAQWGLINVDEDGDGFIRRYLLFQMHNNRAYLPLALHAYKMLYLGSNGTSNIKIDDDGMFVLGAKRIPKIDFNSMLVNFRGPAKSFKTYSLASVVDDATLDLGEEDTDIFEIHRFEGTFKDKIVFIGATAEELQDNKLAPFFSYQGRQRKLPGVELHANALSTVMRSDFIARQGFLSAILAVFILAAITMFVTKWLKPFRGMFAVAGIVLLYIVVALYFFLNERVWVEITAPTFAIILSFVGNVVHQTLTEQRERIRIKKSWEQYMSKDVIDNMLASGHLPEFGGERRELSILFSDIRGFTTFTEKHTSHEVVSKLNEYLTEMVDAIFQHRGTLDKFVGDEIMAVYGAPHYYREHAEKACLTALEMVGRLRMLQRKWSANHEDFFQIGIGINSGKVILGNLGSSQLFDYTVIGDDVNLGARLEGANKQYGTTIIISEFTYRLVRKKARVRELDIVRVKGKSKPVKIFELRGMEPLMSIEQELVIDVYTDALNYYKELKWYQALKEFKRVLRYFPTDGPTRVYIKRCLDFIESPPEETWDGVYDFTTK